MNMYDCTCLLWKSLTWQCQILLAYVTTLHIRVSLSSMFEKASKAFFRRKVIQSFEVGDHSSIVKNFETKSTLYKVQNFVHKSAPS